MRYNVSKICSKSAYSINELSDLLDVNKRTLFRWIKQGLELLDSKRRPHLIMGADLKSFILSKRNKNKATLKDYEFYCMKCRKAVPAKKGSLEVKKTGKEIGKRGRLQKMKQGICRYCNSRINRLI